MAFGDGLTEREPAAHLAIVRFYRVVLCSVIAGLFFAAWVHVLVWEDDAGCGKGRMLSPPASGQVRQLVRFEAHRTTAWWEQRVCCEVPVVHQSRMAGFVLDTACKSGPIDVAFCHKDAGKAQEAIF